MGNRKVTSADHLNELCLSSFFFSGAVFIDGGYAEADKLMRNLHFEESVSGEIYRP